MFADKKGGLTREQLVDALAPYVGGDFEQRVSSIQLRRGHITSLRVFELGDDRQLIVDIQRSLQASRADIVGFEHLTWTEENPTGPIWLGMNVHRMSQEGDALAFNFTGTGDEGSTILYLPGTLGMDWSKVEKF